MWTSVMQVFDSLGKGKSRPVVAKKVTDLLRSADDMLDESQKMLHGIKPHLNPEAFEDYDVQRNKLYLTVVAVKSEIRDKEADRTFFSSPEEKEMFYSQVQKIFRDCRTYHTDIISVSRQAHKRRMQALLDTTIQSVDTAQPVDAAQSADPTQPPPSSTEDQQWACTPSFSACSRAEAIVISIEVSVGSSERGLSSSDGTGATDHRFIATLAQIPQAALAAGDEILSQIPCDDEDTCFRVLLCGNRYRRAAVIELEPHSISQSNDDAERSQDGILQVGDMVMRGNSQSLANHRTVEIDQGPAFITSFISTVPLGGSN